MARPPFQRNGGHVGSNAGSHSGSNNTGGSFPLSASTGSSAVAPEPPTPTLHVTSMGSRTSAPPGTPVTAAPLWVDCDPATPLQLRLCRARLTRRSVVRKHSSIRGCYGVSLEVSDAQRGAEPDVRLETRDSPIDATLYLHGVRGVAAGDAGDAQRRARLDVRTASTVRLRVQRDAGVSVDASVATTKSESGAGVDSAPMPYVHSKCHAARPPGDRAGASWLQLAPAGAQQLA